MTHDHDAVRIGGERFAEVVEHLLRQPGGVLLDQVGDAKRLGRGARAVGARQGGAVARIAAHLHVDGHALAERLLRRRRSGCHGHERQGRQQRYITPSLRHARLPVIGRSDGAFPRFYSPARRRKARSPPAAAACIRADGTKGALEPPDGGREDFGLIGGLAAEGALFTDVADPRRHPEAAPVVERFRASGFEPQLYTLDTYGAVQAWAEAAEKASLLELEAMIASLRQHQFDTVLGPIDFDEKGDLTVQNPAWYVWRGGTYVPLE